MGYGSGPVSAPMVWRSQPPPKKLPLHEWFFTVGTDLRRTRPTRGWLQRAQQADVDHRQVVGRRLNRVAFVMGLHEFAPVGGRAPGHRHGRRLDRFSQMGQELSSRRRSHPGLRPRANLSLRVSWLLLAVSSKPDVAAAPKGTRAETPLLPGPGVSPRQSVTCRASGAFDSDSRRSSLPRHAHRSQPRAACQCSRSRSRLGR